MQRIIVLPKTTPFSTPAEALSFLLQLLDGSFFRRTASGLPRHRGVTPVASTGDWVFFRKIATVASWCFLTQKWKNMHHVNLVPSCTARLPTLKTTKAGFPQGHCSGDAAACSSTEQGYKDLTSKYSQYTQTESKSRKRTTVLSDLLSLPNNYEQVVIWKEVHIQQVWHENAGAIQMKL